MQKRYASPSERAVAARERQREIDLRAELSEKAAKERRKAIQSLGLRGAGKELREMYEKRFTSVLEAWLDGNPGDAIAAVRTHQELRDCRELIRRLTPEEKSHGRSAAEDPDPN